MPEYRWRTFLLASFMRLGAGADVWLAVPWLLSNCCRADLLWLVAGALSLRAA